jgi:hypothetical protein
MGSKNETNQKNIFWVHGISWNEYTVMRHLDSTQMYYNNNACQWANKDKAKHWFTNWSHGFGMHDYYM